MLAPPLCVGALVSAGRRGEFSNRCWRVQVDTKLHPERRITEPLYHSSSHRIHSSFHRSDQGGEQVTMSKHLGRGATALVAIVLVAGACGTGTARPPRPPTAPRSPAASAGRRQAHADVHRPDRQPVPGLLLEDVPEERREVRLQRLSLRQQERRPAADHLHQRRCRAGRRRHRDQPQGRDGLRSRDEGGDGGRHSRVPEHGATRRGGDRRLHLLGERG